MKKLMFIFGTRPEVVKMAPVIFEARKSKYKTVLCFTGQHKDLVVPFLDFFKLKVDYDLNVMKENQSLNALTASILIEVKKILDSENPDMVFVQGDTTTTFAGALAAYYEKIPVAHVEAGLRTYNKYSPFPEEINRQAVSSFAELHFSPTKDTQKNLEHEKRSGVIKTTGNTSIDALRMSIGLIDENKLKIKYSKINFSKKIILVTTHRRENFGKPLQNICATIKRLHTELGVEIILPVHLNPNVKKVIEKELSHIDGIHLMAPLDYSEFVFFMKHAYLIMTDSGGVQEEGPYFGKPILVMRENTERPEGVSAGTSVLIGTNPGKLFEAAKDLVQNETKYNEFAKKVNPYGDGFAAVSIMQEVEKYLAGAGKGARHT